MGVCFWLVWLYCGDREGGSVEGMVVGYGRVMGFGWDV